MNEPTNAGATRRFSVATLLFNPSYYVAGGTAVAAGIVIILLTGWLGSFGNTHVDGVLDLHTGRPAPLWVHLAEGLVGWLLLALPLYIAGRMLSRSRNLRAVDVFGTQAIARFPYLLAVLATLLPGFQRHTAMLAERLQRLRDGEGIAALAVQAGTAAERDQLLFLAVVVFNLLMLVWMVALMYRSYAYTTNMKGARAIVSFIIVLVVAEVLSKVGVQALFILARP